MTASILAGGRTALYRHYDENDRLLYVGISGAPENRMRWHKRHATWVERAVRFTGIWYGTRFAALAAEWKAITEEDPLFNRHGVKRMKRQQRDGIPESDSRSPLSVRLDWSDVTEIDELAAEEGVTRSEMIRLLLDEGAHLHDPHPAA